ncbi:MAG TPA: chaperonin GroEL [Chlamydiales bacterium]|nr:chaperonin GroEL [Chlamydiales bacterium]
MTKELIFDHHALIKLQKGAQILSRAVQNSIGPKGKNVVISDEFNKIISTTDGVSIAREVVLEDRFENIGVQLIKESAEQSAQIVRDGTTTSILLAEKLFQEGVKNIMAGTCPMSLKKGLEKGLEKVLLFLEKESFKLTTQKQIEQVATIASQNNEAVGSIVAKVLEKVGLEGQVIVNASCSGKTEYNIFQGFSFDKGFCSPYFVTDEEDLTVEYENARVFITDYKFNNENEVVALLKVIFETDSSPVLFVIDEIDEKALSSFVVNKVKAHKKLCVVTAPSFGTDRLDRLEDLAIYTNAQVISEKKGMSLKYFDTKMLGKVNKMKVFMDKTILIQEDLPSKEVSKRIQELSAQKEQANLLNNNHLEKRIAALTGKAATIEIAGDTQVAQNELLARTEDSFHAARLCMKKGGVLGGGVCFLKALKELQKEFFAEDEKVGVYILQQALKRPAYQIAKNCGQDGALVVEEILQSKGDFGFDGRSMRFGSMLEAGVIDPLEVVSSSLIHAVSVAKMMLTISSLMIEEKAPSLVSGFNR